MIEIIIAIVATYGITILVVEYDGPFRILEKLRRYVTPFRCVVCACVWLAIPVAAILGLDFVEYLAVIGGVILIDRITE